MELDTNGHIKNFDAWDESFADVTAKSMNIDILDEHRIIISFARDFYKNYKIIPSVRLIIHNCRSHIPHLDSSYLVKLFLRPTHSNICKISGLPKPSSCI